MFSAHLHKCFCPDSRANMQYCTRPSLQQANVTRKSPAIHTGARLAHQKNRKQWRRELIISLWKFTMHFSSCHNSLQTLHNCSYSNKQLTLNCNDAIKDVPFKHRSCKFNFLAEINKITIKACLDVI